MGNIIKNILSIIEEKKIKHAVLAHKLNWGDSKLSKVLNGNLKLTEDMIPVIALALEVDENELTQFHNPNERDLTKHYFLNSDNIEVIPQTKKSLYEKLLTEKDKRIDILEKEIERLKSNQ